MTIPPEERFAGGDQVRQDLAALARGGLLNLAGGTTSVLLGFVFAIVVTRGLHAAKAGVLFEVIALFTIAQALAQFGSDSGLMRMVARKRALGRWTEIRAPIAIALVPVALSGAVIAVAAFALAGPLAALLVHGPHEHAAVVAIRMLAPFVPLGAVSALALAGTRGFGTMVPYVAVEQVAKPFLRPLLAAALMAAGAGIALIALAWAIPVALGVVASLTILYRRVHAETPKRVRTDRTARGPVAREFWSFAAPRGLATLFQVGILWLDVLLIGAIGSSREAGIYTAATRYVTLGNFMLQAIVLVSGPHLSAVLARGERDRALALYRTATWWLTALSWPFYITAAIFAPLLVQVFGQGFSSGANALSVLAIAMLVSMATGPVTVVLLMGGKSSWNMTNAGAALTVNILLNVILIPRFGITGAAVAWAVSIVVANLAPLAQIWLYLDLHPLGRGFAVVAVGAVLCFAGLGIAAREALGATPAGLAIALGGGMLLYAGLLARFRQLLALPILREAVRMRNRPKANLGVSVG